MQLHLNQQPLGFAVSDIDVELTHHLDDFRPHLARWV
jgi:hypothetical protein